MNNYKMVLSYDGTGYDGWQRQKNSSNTLQQTIEQVLERILGEAVELKASGRTDAGVHAIGQVVNFRIDRNLDESEVQRELQKQLPEDIAVKSLNQTTPEFHSRLSATGKCYLYQIDIKETPGVFSRKYAYHNPKKLNLEEMKRAAELLTGKHDFRSFTSEKDERKSAVRTIRGIRIYYRDGLLNLEYEGDGFLYHMVRILSGTLLEIGEGKKRASEISHILDARKRDQAGRMLPPHGLFLKEVFYSQNL